MFALISRSLKIGHVVSKTRSLGQILEKPCVRPRDHIFCPILMKLAQNVCLDEISNEFKIWSFWSKTRPLGQIVETLCTLQKPYFQSDTDETWPEYLPQ